MLVSKKQINRAIEIEKSKAILHWSRQKHDDIRENSKDVPCVFVQRYNRIRYNVGWRFTPANTKIGDIQMVEDTTGF